MAGMEPQVAPNGVVVNLSDRAADEVKKFIVAEDVPGDTAGLRVSVLPGGCSGF